MSLEYDAHHRMRARIGTPLISDDPERDAQILGWMAGRDWTRQGEIIRACAEDLRPSMSPKTARNVDDDSVPPVQAVRVRGASPDGGDDDGA